MKLALLSATTFFLLNLFSCDAPRDRRANYEASFGGPSQSETNFGSPFDYTQPDSSGQGQGGSGYQVPADVVDQGSGQGSSGQIPTHISHCTWPGTSGGRYQSQHPHIGSYTLCQSTQKETDIYIQVQNPINDSTLCLIPTHQSGGKAIFIGEPRCLEVANNSIYRIGLLKNRTGFSGFTINSVMVMKDRAHFFPAPFNQNLLAPDAYLFCSQWLDQYGDPSYCQAFDSVGQYIFHKF